MSQPSAPNSMPIIHYIGDGVQTAFSFPFRVFTDEQLLIFVNGIQIHTRYSITGIGNAQGGTVTFEQAPAHNASVTLKRDIPIRRISDFIEGGELSSHALNREFDQLTALMQQTDYKTATALHFPEQEILPDTVLPPKHLRANRVLGFDNDGSVTMVTAGGGSGSGSIDYSQSGEGAVLRTLTDKVKESVSVKDFGAKGDGIQDDTQAFTLALAAHDCVYVPSGTYAINDTIEITSLKTVFGDGATSILKTDNANIDLLEITGEHNHISNLTLQGGETGIRLYGKTSTCRHNMLYNLTCKSHSTAIELDGYISTDNPCQHNTFSHITIYDPKEYGVLLTRSGMGTAPERNQFFNIQVLSENSGIDIATFSIEAAQKRNSFFHCSADIYGDAGAVFLIGEHSSETLIHDFHGKCHSDMAGILLQNGSQDTSLQNIRIQTVGKIIDDLSGKQYIANNIAATGNDFITNATIMNLTTAQQYQTIQTITPPGPMPVYADLSCGIYVLHAINGQISFQLPKATSGNQGAIMTLIKGDTSNNPVMIHEQGGTGPNGKVFSISSVNDRVSLISDGSIWRILHTNMNIISARAISGTTSYIIDLNKNVHTINAASGIVTVQLPSASSDLSIGRVITIKKTDTSSNAVRVTESGAVGPDGAVLNITAANAAVTLASSGTSWVVIGRG